MPRWSRPSPPRPRARDSSSSAPGTSLWTRVTRRPAVPYSTGRWGCGTRGARSKKPRAKLKAKWGADKSGRRARNGLDGHGVGPIVLGAASRLALGDFSREVSVMSWEAPDFIEVKMDAEINSYQDDFDREQDDRF